MNIRIADQTQCKIASLANRAAGLSPSKSGPPKSREFQIKEREKAMVMPNLEIIPANYRHLNLSWHTTLGVGKQVNVENTTLQTALGSRKPQ